MRNVTDIYSDINTNTTVISVKDIIGTRPTISIQTASANAMTTIYLHFSSQDRFENFILELRKIATNVTRHTKRHSMP